MPSAAAASVAASVRGWSGGSACSHHTTAGPKACPLGPSSYAVRQTSPAWPRHTQVVAVKFYTEWCGWSQRLAPTWEALAAAYHNSTQVVIAQVECDREPMICDAAEVGAGPAAARLAGVDVGVGVC